jgi:hypothetical protein
MRRGTTGVVGVLAAVVLTAGLAGSRAEEDEEMPIEGLRIPVERYDTGAVKTELTALRARVPEEGDIVAAGVRVCLYDESGGIQSVIEAEDCRYDRSSGAAFSDSRVRIERDKVTVTGVGFKWSASDETVKILGDVKVVLVRRPVLKERKK